MFLKERNLDLFNRQKRMQKHISAAQATIHRIENLAKYAED